MKHDVPVAVHTLDDQLLFSVVSTAHGAGQLAVAGATLSVVTHPVTAYTWRCGPTVQAPHTPGNTQHLPLYHCRPVYTQTQYSFEKLEYFQFLATDQGQVWQCWQHADNLETEDSAMPGSD